jgi:hypothetical protein
VFLRTPEAERVLVNKTNSDQPGGNDLPQLSSDSDIPPPKVPTRLSMTHVERKQYLGHLPVASP